MLCGLITTKGLSFPDNIRHGYNSCSSCHVSATGGGILTPYGRMTSAEVMSSFGSEDEGQPFHGLLKTSDSLDIGGDFSYLSIATKRYERAFTMQREASIAVNYNRKYYLVAQGGAYGELATPDIRKAFIQGEPFENWVFKAGRFFPAFGIMSNEHSYLYRSRYFNQGRETLNAEITYREKQWEVSATKIFGHPSEFSNGYLVGKEGWAARASLLPSKVNIFSFSYLILYDQFYNVEYSGAISGLWAFNEQFWIEAQASNNEAYGRIGIEPYKGFSVKPTMEWEYDKRLPRTELVFQWLPRSHFDFQLTCSKTSWVLLSHYYL